MKKEPGPGGAVDLEKLLHEFAAIADDWFAKHPFVFEYNKFIQRFFEPENLTKAEWPDFQKLADHLHSLNSLAIAKGNAFGKPNYPIEKYREGFAFLARGSGSVEDRMRLFMSDKSKYASKYLGHSVVSELVGQLFPEQFVFMNRRDIEAAAFLGVNAKYPAGADFPTKFIAFNQALTPLLGAYRRIVGPQHGIPIGLAVDQFLSWVYVHKIPAGEAVPEDEPPTMQQVWAFAPGPQAQYWAECIEDGIAPMGWDELGPLDAFADREALHKRLKEIWPTRGEQSNTAQCTWEFCHVMKEGDLVIAKRGNLRIVGIGIVKGNYRFDSSRAEYKHIRDVEWTHQGDWALPEGYQFATKTLTNITRARDFVAQIMATVGLKSTDVKVEAGVKHFWLNCAPSQWRVSTWKVAEEQTYTTHNEDGNKRRLYACFQAAQPGDLVVGYETSPERKATSLLTITKGIHLGEDSKECVSFRVIEQFKEPKTLEQLRAIPALADCDPVHGQHQGSLFQITKAEYEAIAGTPPTSEVEAREPEPIADTYTVEDALDGLFVDESQFHEWLQQWRARQNLILQGAPGVGKTFVARRLAYALIGIEDPSRVAMVQFHQSYGYEDFVQGYRPGPNGSFELKNGAFYEFAIKARQSPKDRPFVFIVDEINRGNLSKILGELLMLIEPDKRGESHALRLAYQGEGQSFFVPENLFILGLMNTADRSLAVVDYALRRRFSFVTVSPAFGSPEFREFLSAACGDDLADRILVKLSHLNAEIAKDLANLGPGFCIGHSYFCRVQSLADYRDVVRYQIAPLLREYWFDQPKRADDLIQNLAAI